MSPELWKTLLKVFKGRAFTLNYEKTKYAGDPWGKETLGALDTPLNELEKKHFKI